MDRSKRSPAAVIAGGLIVAALNGCGGEETVASKSAAAFREAQKKGETFGDAGHSHGHGAMTPGGGHAEHDAGMATSPAETTAATMHDHGGHGDATQAGHSHGSTAGAPADHSAMQHGSAERQSGDHGGHAGMHHGRSPAAPGGRTSAGQARAEATTGHAGHGSASPATPAAATQTSGAGHSGHTPSPGGMPPATPVPASEVPTPGQPAKTLRPDPLDSPAATSVLDAQRSAEMAHGMAGGGHGGHGEHGVGRYRHVDAGRGPGAYEGSQDQTPGAGAHQHGGPATPAPSGQAGEHSHHEPAGDATAAPAAAVYVCPMHPEVTSKTPGTCPKCGMALVQRRKE
jgi:hypothetical protein